MMEIECRRDAEGMRSWTVYEEDGWRCAVHQEE
jgi:hypothetical protein